MRLFFFVCLSMAFAATSTAQDIPEEKVLFSFDSVQEARWGIVNDGVMGGRSKGYGEINKGMLRFWGELVTRGGGFTSVRSRQVLDLSSYEGIELRVQGNGRTFEVELSDGLRYRGRTVSRRASFETNSEWQTIRIPFSSFRSSVFGQPVNASPLNTSNIRAVGLYIVDGIDGEFELQVDEIRVYRAKM